MNNIVGHENVKSILKKIIDEDKIGHAYLFVGKDGIGKKMLAIEFAKMIMTKEEPKIFSEADFKIISPEKGIIKVEEIRSLINEVYLKPTYSKRKVFIIDDADKMNASSQNALLKVLEEPPLYATLILITSSKEKIIRTILSRIVEVKFNGLSNEEIKSILGDNAGIKYARGSVARAMSLTQNDYFDIANDLVDLFKQKSLIDIINKMDELKSNDNEIISILELVKVIYHDELENDTYKKIKTIKLIDDTINNLNRNANVELSLYKLAIEICRL